MFLIVALALLGISVLVFSIGYNYVGWGCLAVGALLLVKVPLAWYDCRSSGGLSPHGGGTCPECGSSNRVQLWSL